ncbi:MAG: TetR/AcrR family transcriptional regulator [Acidimicrobiales bacterium]
MAGRATSTRASKDADVDPVAVLGQLLGTVADRPASALDDAIDAAAQCFARHGIGHASVLDIARQMGVSKATAHRYVGSIDDALRLVLARELHDVADEIVRALEGVEGVDRVLVPAIIVARHASQHPMLLKLLADEPNMVGELLPVAMSVLDGMVSLLGMYLEACMRSGDIATSDPTALADLIGRLLVMAMLIPPADLTAHFRTALLPHLAVR